MARLQLFVLFIVGAALASSPVGAAPDCTVSSKSCSVMDEEAAATADKNLLMLKGKSPKQPPTQPSFGQEEESLAAKQKWWGNTWDRVAPSPDTRRRRRRDPTDFKEGEFPKYRSRGTNCGNISLTIVEANNLRDADQVNVGHSDPWVQFSCRLCGDDIGVDEVVFRETPSISNTANPVWNYKTTIMSVDLDINVWFEVLDSDWTGNDKLGYKYLKLQRGREHKTKIYLDNGYGASLTYDWHIL